MQKTAIRIAGRGPDEEWAATEKVLAWFFSFPDREFSLSDLCDEIGIAKTTANGVVTKLEKEGFLTIEPFGRSWRIRTVKAHRYHQAIRIPLMLRAVYTSGLLDTIIELVPGAKATILFGSFRTGDDGEESDLDIAVEVADGTTGMQNIGVMSRLLYRKNVPVNLYIFTRKNIDPNLFANIANGIVLNGFLEVRA